MRTALAVTGLLLALTACVVPQRIPLPPLPPQQSSVVPSASSSSADVAEGDAEEQWSVAPPIAISQRLLTGGLLEMGAADAPVTLLLFTNHFCGYCRDFEETFRPRLTAEFAAPGKLRMVTVPFPLKKYPESNGAAAMLLCAGRQGKGQEMHALLFEGVPSRTELAQRGKALGLDVKQFESCLAADETSRTLATQKNLADALGVTLVPTFFLNGQKTVGLPTPADLRGAIEAMLSQ